eukprot:7347703-Pyramimonas_sp.AAC.1
MHAPLLEGTSHTRTRLYYKRPGDPQEQLPDPAPGPAEDQDPPPPPHCEPQGRHRSNKTLTDVLKGAGAQGPILKLAAEFRCEACERHKNKPMESVVAPHSPATPGQAIETDGFYWTDLRDEQTWAGTCIVDAGTRRSGGKLNLKGRLMRSGEEFRNALQHTWTHVTPPTLSSKWGMGISRRYIDGACGSQMKMVIQFVELKFPITQMEVPG